MGWLPSLPYPPAGDGYWAPVTSTINWCEEDYYATHYSAEIINSFTNLWFIYLAQRGIRNCISNKFDKVFLYGFISYLMIGVGSFIFHSTLRYSMQLLDELSMIYTSCILFFASFEHGQTPKTKVLLAAFVTGIAIFVTAYYHYLGDPVFHQNVFALLTAIVFARGVWATETSLNAYWRSKDPIDVDRVELARRDRRNHIILSAMRRMMVVGLATVGLGFFLWNLDNIFCSNLRRWRREVGLPWGIFLELHGHWHLLTAIAEYFNLVWSMWVRLCLEGRQDEVEIVWPRMWTSMPYLVRRSVQRDQAKIHSVNGIKKD